MKEFLKRKQNPLILKRKRFEISQNQNLKEKKECDWGNKEEKEQELGFGVLGVDLLGLWSQAPCAGGASCDTRSPQRDAVRLRLSRSTSLSLNKSDRCSSFSFMFMFVRRTNKYGITFRELNLPPKQESYIYPKK